MLLTRKSEPFTVSDECCLIDGSSSATATCVALPPASMQSYWAPSYLIMSNYRSYRVPGGTYFFTVNLLERRQDTLVRHIDVLREAIRKTRKERPFLIDAWVVLPDHMHCIWTLPSGDDDFSNRWKSIKICFVQAIPRTEIRFSVRIA
jgi:hypothetical protein